VAREGKGLEKERGRSIWRKKIAGERKWLETK
jgi:hypothetical protein